jgi:hypothetical protein
MSDAASSEVKAVPDRSTSGLPVPWTWDRWSAIPRSGSALSGALGDALNAGYRYREVRCLGCDTHQTVALDIVRRPKTTPIHELERYMRCKDCSELRGYPYKCSHLVAMRATRFQRATRLRRGSGEARCAISIRSPLTKRPSSRCSG